MKTMNYYISEMWAGNPCTGRLESGADIYGMNVFSVGLAVDGSHDYSKQPTLRVVLPMYRLVRDRQWLDIFEASTNPANNIGLPEHSTTGDVGVAVLPIGLWRSDAGKVIEHMIPVELLLQYTIELRLYVTIDQYHNRKWLPEPIASAFRPNPDPRCWDGMRNTITQTVLYPDQDGVYITAVCRPGVFRTQPDWDAVLEAEQTFSKR